MRRKSAPAKAPIIAAVLAGFMTISLRANAADEVGARASASDNFKLSGSFRARYELLNGQARAGLENSPDLLSFRTTLLAEYAVGAFQFGAEMYDSRAYLEDSRTGVGTGEVNALDLVQAYVAATIKDPFGKDTSASLRAGRFTLNLGTRRLVAADDYRNTTNGYTGLRVDLARKGGVSSTLIYTLPQRRLPDDQASLLDNDIELDKESSALVLWGGMVTIPQWVGEESLDVSFFRLTEKDQPDLATRNRRLNTVDARLFRDPAPGQWDYEFEGAYQDGSIRSSTAPTATDLDVTASFFHLEVGYQSAAAWQPRISVEYDQASGEDGDADFTRFDTLFGMRRADFSPSGIFAVVSRTNLRSPGVRFEFVPSKRLEAFVSYRHLWLDSSSDSFGTTGVRDATGRSGRSAADQLDMRTRYWLVPKSLRAEINGAMLIKGRFLEDAPNAPKTGNTHYLSLNVISFF